MWFDTDDNGRRSIGWLGWTAIIVSLFLLPPIGVVWLICAWIWSMRDGKPRPPDYIIKRTYPTTAHESEVALEKARKKARAMRREAGLHRKASDDATIEPEPVRPKRGSTNYVEK